MRRRRKKERRGSIGGENLAKDSSQKGFGQKDAVTKIWEKEFLKYGHKWMSIVKDMTVRILKLSFDKPQWCGCEDGHQKEVRI